MDYANPAQVYCMHNTCLYCPFNFEYLNTLFNKMNLSLCITTHNRYEMTIESFAKVIDDPRIDDIVIMDDCSEPMHKQAFYDFMLNGPSRKVSYFEQAHNVGMSRNKRDAIGHAKNEWCILFDSDNIIDSTYLDAFYRDTCSDSGRSTLGDFKDDKGYIFCPDFAKPNFNYTKYSNRDKMPFGIFDSKACADFIKEDDFNCLMNTCNYIVNRDFYLKTYRYNKEHIASDTIWHNYNHLKAGGQFRVISNMQYYHRTHAGSGFLQDVKYNMAQSEKVRLLIQQL